MSKKTNVVITVDKNLLRLVDDQVKKIGYGATRSGWMSMAIERQLKVEMGFSYLSKIKPKKQGDDS